MSTEACKPQGEGADAPNVVLLSGSTNTLPPMPWQPFDYANPPEDGVVWAAVSAPETDCDVDDYGRTVGWHTGETEHSVCLVRLSGTPDRQVEFEPVDAWNLGRVPDEGVVTHWAPVTAPRHPKAYTGLKGSNEDGTIASV